MKRFVFPLLALACACGGADKAKTEVSAAPPTVLTVNDLTGTFNGSTMLAAKDSVTAVWHNTVTLGAGGTTVEGKWVNAAYPKDTVPFTQVIQGDSVISESSPFTDRTAPKGSGQVHWKAVGRAHGMEWSGTSVVMPVGKDTVLQSLRWKATRTP